MRRPEAALQRACIGYLRLLPAPERGGPYWTAINPNPAKGKVHGAISKSLGAKAGVPDLLLVWRGKAIFIELKAKGGRLSDVQRAAASEITLAGGLWAEIRSTEELVEFLGTIGLPVPGRVAA